MKFIDRMSLVIFSIIILILSTVMSLIIFGWFEVEYISEMLNEILNNPTYSEISIAVSIVLIVMAIKCIYFRSSGSSQKMDLNSGILLENSEGKLLITKQTLQNMSIGVIKGFNSTQEAVANIDIDKENNIRIYINLMVKENAIIKELSAKIQTKIKETIKTSLGLEVKEINIQIKNIEPSKNQ